MRLRNDKNAINILNNNSHYFIDILNKNNINKLKQFSKNKECYLEIGMGKGQFLINNALNNININYLGLEKNMVICSKAIKKLLALSKQLNNIKIINFDAINLLSVLDHHSIKKIFLNFSDPWPKKRHIKNRLTNPKFLKIYQELLTNDGIVELKTDNDDFFKYTIETLNNENNIRIIYQTSDLHHNLDNEFNINNIETEYENRFKLLNKNINKVIFCFIN